MDSDLALGVITIVGFLLIFAAVMIPANKKGKLKQVILLQDNTILALRKELSEHQNLYHNKQLEITRVAAENAVLKQRVIKLESHIDTDKHVIESAIKFGLKIEINYEERSSFLDLQPLLDKIKAGELDAYYNKGKDIDLVGIKSFAKEDIRSASYAPLNFSSEKKTDDVIDTIRKNLTKKNPNRIDGSKGFIEQVDKHMKEALSNKVLAKSKPTKKKKGAKKLQGKGNINKKG